MRIRNIKRIVNYRFFPSAAGPSYEAETIAYRDRVIADGGEVIDLDYVDSVYKKLKELNLLDSLKHWSSASAGVRKDSVGYVSKVYSLDGANDGAQTTGASQPIFTAEGFSFDGSDDYLPMNVDGTALNLFTILTGLKLSSGQPQRGVYSWATKTKDIQPRAYLTKVDDTQLKSYRKGAYSASYSYPTDSFFNHAYSFNGVDSWKSYINNSLVNTMVSSDDGYKANSLNLFIGEGYHGFVKSVFKKVSVFDSELTPEQITALNSL
jgi:hypothetical protein